MSGSQVPKRFRRRKRSHNEYEDRGRCFYHKKWSYATYEECAEVARHKMLADDTTVLRPHWCPYAGAYHLTSKTPAEYNRRRADGDAREDGTVG